MGRRIPAVLLPAALVVPLALLLGACSSPVPALTDPNEIITRGLQATAEAKSFHLGVTLSGAVTVPQTGGSLNLQGTTITGDVDVTNASTRLAFDAPGLFNLTGELISIGSDAYIKTSLAPTQYIKVSGGDAGLDVKPDAVLRQLVSLLDEEGVETAKLDDVGCGDATCYAVRLTIPSSLLAGAGVAGIDAGDFIGEALVLDLQFDRETLRLVQLSTDVDGGDAGSFALLATFSNYDAQVQVSPPPSEQVTDGFGLPF